MHKGKCIKAKSLALATLIAALLIGGPSSIVSAYQAWQQGIPQSILSLPHGGPDNSDHTLDNVVVSVLPPYSLSNAEYAIRPGSSTIVQNIQDINAAIAIIETYASLSDASDLALSLLHAAGVSGMVSDNLPAYKQGVAAAMVEEVDQTPDLQALINLINRQVGLIAAYATLNDASAMTLEELTAAGIGDLEPYKLASYREAVAGADTADADTTTDIQKIIDAVNTATAGSSENSSAATLLNAPQGRLRRIDHAVTVGGIGIATYSYKVDDGDWSPEIAAGDLLEFSVTTAGEHTLHVIGKNGNGRWQAREDATKASWMLDLTPPTALVLNEPMGASGLSAIELSIGGEDVQSYRYRPCDAGCEWSGIYPSSVPVVLADLADGLQTLAVIGADTAGNWQSEIDQTVVYWTVDHRLPTAVFTSAPAAAINDSDFVLSVGHNVGQLEVDEYKYSLDGGTTWIQQSANRPITMTAMNSGRYTVYVNGYNAAGDIWQDGGSGETLDNATECSWEVDRTAPLGPTLTIAAGVPASTTLDLAWVAPESGLKCYHIYYADVPISWESLPAATMVHNALVPGPAGYTEHFAVDGLAPGTMYYATVIAEDAAGNLSDPGNTVRQETADQRPKISNLHLTAGGLNGDNGQARELTVLGKNFVFGPGNNIVRFVSSKGVFDVVNKAGSTVTKLLVDVPTGACRGRYRLQVVNKNGVSAASSLTYSITPSPSRLPEVGYALPAGGSEDTDTTITIVGRNLDDPVSVSLISLDGDTSVDLIGVVGIDATTLEATVPSRLPIKVYSIRVTTAQGTNEASLARFEVFQALDLESSTAPINTTCGVFLPADARVPVDLTLTTDDREDVPPGSGTRVKVAVSIDSGCQFESEQSADYWTDYSGVIKPPRPVPPPQAAIDAIGENVVAFTMGAEKRLRLKNGQTMFVEVEVVMASRLPAPVVYYIPANGTPELAGVNGVRDGIAYEPGGYILASRVDTPGTGYTTYTIGLLLDHMSLYAAGKPPADADGGGGGCFIDTVTDGPHPSPQAEVFRRVGNRLMLIFLLAAVLAWPAVSRCEERLRRTIDGRQR